MNTLRQRLHIVVTCTSRKRVVVPATMRLRGMPVMRTRQRAMHWIEHISSPNNDAVPARELYAGEHWAIARNLPAAALGFVEPTLWVASAGWGLIPANATIRPYSATFSPRHPDSVAAETVGTQAWWNALAEWEGPTSSAARSLTALVTNHSRDRILLVLSQAYLAACRADLRAAIEGARDGQISIIAAGASADPHLTGVILPADARLQHHVSGSRGALNVRIAQEVLTAGLYDHATMYDYLRRQLDIAPKLVSYERQRLSDDDVLTFIRRHLAEGSSLSHTRLLRTLRDSGKACEQARFAALFATATRSQL